jgi:hypothetical protein
LGKDINKAGYYSRFYYYDEKVKGFHVPQSEPSFNLIQILGEVLRLRNICQPSPLPSVIHRTAHPPLFVDGAFLTE